MRTTGAASWSKWWPSGRLIGRWCVGFFFFFLAVFYDGHKVTTCRVIWKTSTDTAAGVTFIHRPKETITLGRPEAKGKWAAAYFIFIPDGIHQAAEKDRGPYKITDEHHTQNNHKNQPIEEPERKIPHHWATKRAANSSHQKSGRWRRRSSRRC